jgi:hypothetical protein
MSLVRLVIACLLVSASTVYGQTYPPPAPGAGNLPCMPYQGTWSIPVCPPGQAPACSLYTPACLVFPMGTETIYETDFANAFLGVEGLELVYVTLKNKSDESDIVLVEVTISGTAPLRKTYTLAPQERPEPILLNEWPELANIKGGISIVVRSDRTTAVSVTMHPRTTNMTEFWRSAKFLEGQQGQ